MNTLLNDRAFMAVFEKSKLEAKQRARQDSDLMVEGIYAQMFVDLSGWVDANQQQRQQQREEKEKELQQESQVLPFIIETDGTTEVCAQIAVATSSKQNSEAAPTLQNKPSLINQQQENPSNPPEMVVKEEITDSVTVIEHLQSPAKQTGIPKMLKPKENNATVLSNRTTSLNLIPFENNVQNNVAAPTQNNPLSNLFIPTTTTTSSTIPTTVCPIIKTSSGTTFILLTPTACQTQRNQQAPPPPPPSTFVPVNNTNKIVHLQATLPSLQSSTSTFSPSQLVKYQPIMSRMTDTRNNSTNIIIGNKDRRNKEEASINVGGTENSFEEGSKEGENNVEMVDVQHQQVYAPSFPCFKCNLRFISETHLLIHSSIHNQQVPLKCNFCDKYFVDKSRLEKHIIIHYKQNPLIYTCTICSAQFNRSKKYHRHMAQVHSGEKNCDESIQYHQKKSCAVQHQKIYWCTWKGCRFTGVSREDVVAHVRNIHFVVQQNEKHLKMETVEVDIDKYIRKVPPSVAARRRLLKTMK